MSVPTTVHLQRCLLSLRDRDPSARGELLAHAQRRLQALADRMFHRFPSLHSHEHADDLFQEAMIRLWNSLEAIGPATVEEFMGLAALQMRRALCDLARYHFGRSNRVGASEYVPLSVDGSGNLTVKINSKDAPNAPDELMRWSEFHSAVDRLPEPDRTAFDLLYYHELTHAEVAVLMKVSERQVRRYWQSARRQLFQMMEGVWPDL